MIVIDVDRALEASTGEELWDMYYPNDLQLGTEFCDLSLFKEYRAATKMDEELVTCYGFDLRDITYAELLSIKYYVALRGQTVPVVTEESIDMDFIKETLTTYTDFYKGGFGDKYDDLTSQFYGDNLGYESADYLLYTGEIPIESVNSVVARVGEGGRISLDGEYPTKRQLTTSNLFASATVHQEVQKSNAAVGLFAGSFLFTFVLLTLLGRIPCKE